jgi:hypothetical protein
VRGGRGQRRAAKHVRLGQAGHLFTIYNPTYHPITLASTDGKYADPPAPVGTVVNPGQAIGFEVGWVAARDVSDTVTFRAGATKFDVTMKMSWMGVPSADYDDHQGVRDPG